MEKERKRFNIFYEIFDFTKLLTILFIALKICKIVTWTWFIVISPILIIPSLILVTIIIAIILALFGYEVE